LEQGTLILPFRPDSASYFSVCSLLSTERLILKELLKMSILKMTLLRLIVTSTVILYIMIPTS